MDDAVLPTSSPEALGVDPDALQTLLAELDAENDSLHAFVLVRGGHIVAEAEWAPYTADRPHELYSVSKSFTSAAVGLAIEEGLLALDDRVVQFFPEQTPVPTDERRLDLRIRHLLTMTTGHASDPTDAVTSAERDWVGAFLRQPLEADPGSLFVYNTAATFVLSALVQHVTGQRLLDYLRPRLLEPLGIREAHWQQNPDGIDTGGFGLSVSTRAIAAFGTMLLNRGELRGQQLLAPDWVTAATSPLVPSVGENPDWEQGYGYQFWTSRHGYRGDGMYGQFCLVLPEHEAVVAITSYLGDMQKPLDILWRHREALFAGAPDAAAPLGEPARFAFEVPAPPPGDVPIPAVDQIRYRLDAEWPGAPRTLALQTTAEGTALLLGTDDGEHGILFGADRWEPGTTLFQGEEKSIFARGAWTTEGEFQGRVLWADGPHGIEHRIRFLPDGSVEWTSREMVPSFLSTPDLRATGTPA